MRRGGSIKLCPHDWEYPLCNVPASLHRVRTKTIPVLEGEDLEKMRQVLCQKETSVESNDEHCLIENGNVTTMHIVLIKEHVYFNRKWSIMVHVIAIHLSSYLGVT